MIDELLSSTFGLWASLFPHSYHHLRLGFWLLEQGEEICANAKYAS